MVYYPFGLYIGLPSLPEWAGDSEFHSIFRLPSEVAREIIISRNAPNLVLRNGSILKYWNAGLTADPTKLQFAKLVNLGRYVSNVLIG